MSEGWDDSGVTEYYSGDEAAVEYITPISAWTPAIPEPYWFRHWIFWIRPGCYICRVKFRNRAEWGDHWTERHLVRKP